MNANAKDTSKWHLSQVLNNPGVSLQVTAGVAVLVVLTGIACGGCIHGYDGCCGAGCGGGIPHGDWAPGHRGLRMVAVDG